VTDGLTMCLYARKFCAVMPVPKVDFVKILGPILVRLCPELRAGQITKGKIIPISDINPLNETEEARALNRQFKRQERNDGTKDSSQVINLDRAIKCVEEAGGKGGLVAQVLRDCVKVLIKGGFGKDDNTTEKLLNPIITCLRENALRQDTPRVFSTRGQYHRPARGHGHGRRVK